MLNLKGVMRLNLKVARLGMVVALGWIAGCIPTAARDDARYLGVLTQKVQEESVKFAAFREELDGARQLNIDILEENSLETEQATHRLLSTWSLAAGNGNPDRLKKFNLIGAAMDGYAKDVDAARQLQSQQQTDRAALHEKVVDRSAQLTATAQALARLAEQPDFKTQATFLIGFGQDVRKDLKESEAAAAADTAAGKTKAAAAKSQAQDSALNDAIRTRATTGPTT